MLVVSNNWAGTADIVDPRTFKRIKRLNVVPDKAARIAEIGADPTAKFYYDSIRALVGEGHDQYVDDGFVSRDGRARLLLAAELRRRRGDRHPARTRSAGARTSTATAPTTWRSPRRAAAAGLRLDGARGRRARHASRARSSATIASGDSPHESNFSRDGSTIFHASIGTVYTDTDDPALDATKGERVFEIIDARHAARSSSAIDMGAKMAEFGRPGMSAAVRPMAISPDERFVYFQLSFFHGFAEYDLRADKITRVIDLPLSDVSEGMPRTEYVLDSAHHGLGDEPEGHEALRGRDHVRLRGDREARPAGAAADRPRRARRRTGRHRATTAGTASSPSRGEDRVVGDLVQDRRARSPRIKVGDHPQRMRPGACCARRCAERGRQRSSRTACPRGEMR